MSGSGKRFEAGRVLGIHGGAVFRWGMCGDAGRGGEEGCGGGYGRAGTWGTQAAVRWGYQQRQYPDSAGTDGIAWKSVCGQWPGGSGSFLRTASGYPGDLC